MHYIASKFSSLSWPSADGVGLLVGTLVFQVGSYVFLLLAGRSLSVEAFGLFSSTVSWLFVISIFSGALDTSAKKYGSQEQSSNYSDSLITLTRLSLILGVVLSVGWLLLTPLMNTAFGIVSQNSWLLFGLVIMPTLLSVMTKGWLVGNMRFLTVGLLLALEGILKIGLGLWVLFLDLGLYAVLFSYVISVGLICLISLWKVKNQLGSLRSLFEIRMKKESDRRLRRYVLMAGVGAGSIMLLYGLDMLVVRWYLSPNESGVYAFYNLYGKAILLGSGVLANLYLPKIARAVDQSRDYYRWLFSGLGLVASLGVLGLAGGYFFGVEALSIFGKTDGALDASQLLTYMLGASGLAVVSYVVQARLMQSDYKAVVLPLIGLSIYTAFLGGSGYSLEHHLELYMVLGLGAGVMGVFYLLAQLLWLKQPLRQSQEPSDGLSILVLNWRDTAHQWSGGAEVYLQALTERWAASGHRVTIFCGNDQHSPPHETIRGVEIIRKGGFVTVYLWALLYYVFKFRGSYDVIVDCENGIPFFSPLYSRAAHVLLIFHVHQEVLSHLPKPAISQHTLKDRIITLLAGPLALLAGWLERHVMPTAYSNASWWTISESSKQAIERVFGSAHDVQVITPGISLENYGTTTKSDYPLISYVGRLKEYKSLPVLLHAFARVLAVAPTAKLAIAGIGEADKELRAIARELEIADHVRFLGRISEEEKVALFGASWVSVNPSYMEGFGITTVESFACGTCVVGSNIPGLWDVIDSEVNGILVPHGNSYQLSQALLGVINDSRFRNQLSSNALLSAERYAWHYSADYSLKLLMNAVESFQPSYLSLTRTAFLGRWK